MLRTRVLEAGKGPVVLMLHGNPDNADEWRPLMFRLAPHFRCLAPDFPGYGSAQLPASFNYTLDELVRFVDAITRVMRVNDPLTLVIHDTGGMAGTAWAARNVARLRGMVITNTVAFEGFSWFAIARTWGGRSALARWRARLGMKALEWNRGALFKRIFGAQSPQLDSGEIERYVISFALNPVAKEAALRQFRECIGPQFFAGFDAMWKDISARVPCRVLWGDDDPYIEARHAWRFGTSQVTVLPGVGHWVALVAPDALAAEVEALEREAVSCARNVTDMAA
jgi:haloalkane dehalogenase